MKLKFGLLARIITAIVLAVFVGLFVPEWFVRIFATFNGLFGGFLSWFIGGYLRNWSYLLHFTCNCVVKIIYQSWRKRLESDHSILQFLHSM